MKGADALCLHEFEENIDSDFDKRHWFSYGQFDQMLDLLSFNNFKFVSMENVLTDQIEGTKNILITLDDGRASILTAYEKILKPRKILPVLAIITGFIDGSFLTWEQIQYLQHSGCHIASHGCNHIRHATLSNEDLQKELIGSKQILEQKLKPPITTYVYPYGSLMVRAELLTCAGYTVAFALRDGLINWSSNFLALPRYSLDQLSWQQTIDRIIKGSN